MKYSGWDYLDHMLNTCDELEICLVGVTTATSFAKDIKTRRAVVMCLLDLGELLKGLTKVERSLFPNDSSRHIIGFRDRAAHGYHTMDFDIVYSLATKIVPIIFKTLKDKKDFKI